MLTKTNVYKLEEGRGKGHGAEYKPWIETREVSSIGTCSNPIDWKTGRTVELLSQGESIFWHILRWDDTVDDIREQYPLDIETTLKICDDFNIKHPHDRKTYMTSDFYVTYKDGTEKIFSVKNSRDVLNQKRTKEKLSVEACYWKKYRNIDYEVVFKDEMNQILAENIRFVCVYYDRSRVFDETSLLKHLIATKQIKVDMETQFLDIPTLLETYRNLLSTLTDYYSLIINGKEN